MQQHKPAKLIFAPVAVSLLLLAQLAIPALAESSVASAGAPTIRKVDVTDDETQILIYGKNFCANPVVKLSTITLDIDSVDLGGPELIVADLPENPLVPAGYRLSVDCGVNNRGNGLLGYVFVSIGDIGPRGYPGASGADGKDGADGSDGATGAPGTAGATGAVGVSQWERLKGACLTVPIGAITSTVVTCTVGKKLLGGGYLKADSNACNVDIGAAHTTTILSSGPTTDNAWRLSLFNQSGVVVFYSAYAICAVVD